MDQMLLESLIQELLDGTILPENLVLLEAEFMSNPAAVQSYLDYTEIHSLLNKDISVQSLQSNIVPVDLILKRQKRKVIRIASFAAAAIVLIGIIFMSVLEIDKDLPPVAFKSSPGTEYTLSHSSTKTKEKSEALTLAHGSNLKISQGSVELTFKSGVKSIIKAPADVTLQADDTLSIQQGVAWFNVPSNASGFTVQSSELHVVDLGTEFGVIVTPRKHDEVHTFKGKVRVTALQHYKETAELNKGDSRQATPTGKLITIPSTSDAFLTKLPNSLPYLHWSFDNASNITSVEGNFINTTSIYSTIRDYEQDQEIIAVPGKFGSAIQSKNLAAIKTSWRGIEGSKPRSISFWVKLPPAERYRNQILGWGEHEHGKHTNKSFYTFVETESVKTTIGLSLQSYWIKGTTNLNDNQWHHVAFVYTGGSNAKNEPDIITYINGNKEQTTSYFSSNIIRNTSGQIPVDTYTGSNNSQPLTFFEQVWHEGHGTPSNKPIIDEVYIFEGAIDEEAIKNLYLTNSTSN